MNQVITNQQYLRLMIKLYAYILYRYQQLADIRSLLISAAYCLLQALLALRRWHFVPLAKIEQGHPPALFSACPLRSLE